ncbi:hypothetical protein RK21_04876 [Pseudomonas plecoglossicida]|nr:hypothetical protein RK21_04876 [Pseudomonas plecoglossicida]
MKTPLYLWERVHPRRGRHDCHLIQDNVSSSQQIVWHSHIPPELSAKLI